MAERTIFDHLALAVHRWADGYPALVETLGGRWTSGGVTETFSPGQLKYAGAMKMELLAPGSGPEGFVSSFLAGHGPGPHHITFKVRDMDEFASGASELGYELMGAHLDLPGRRESFIHPKASGFGTLLQALEYDERYGGGPPPDGFPTPAAPALEVGWVALVVDDMARSFELFAGVLAGDEVARGEAGGGDWLLLGWPPARRLLLLDQAAARVLGRTGGRCGVDHVVFVAPGGALPDPGDQVARGDDLTEAAALGLPIFVATSVPVVRN